MARGFSTKTTRVGEAYVRAGTSPMEQDIRRLEAEGMTRSDAQSAYEAQQERAKDLNNRPESALNHTVNLFLDSKPPANAKSYEVERWNRRNADAQKRFELIKDIKESSNSSKEFFEKLKKAEVFTNDETSSTRTGVLYNGNLDQKGRAEQFFQSIKEGLREGAFGQTYRGASVSFKGSRKDEIRIDLPEGIKADKMAERMDMVRSISNLGSAMTSTYREHYGDGFGHTSMPKVIFRSGGNEVDSIRHI